MTLSPLISRALALAILFALAWSGYAYVYVPLEARYRLNQETIDRDERLEARFVRLGNSREALEAELAAVQSRLAAAGLYLTAESDALASAELQNRAKAAVEANGAILSSTQTLPAKDEGNYRRIGIRVQMTTLMEPLQRILHELESTRPYLFVDNLDLRRRVKRSRADGKDEPEPESPLTARFDLYGYLRSGGA